jgi:hypothetical protein
MSIRQQPQNKKIPSVSPAGTAPLGQHNVAQCYVAIDANFRPEVPLRGVDL